MVPVSKELYGINNVVDLLNLVSISTGFSIGGYDAGKINGEVVFGIGCKNEPYEGIGRGKLNIESLPVFDDNHRFWRLARTGKSHRNGCEFAEKICRG